MTTDPHDLIKHITAAAPLPHTAAAHESAGRSVIVASNGRVLGWVATRSGNWRTIADLWTSAVETLDILIAARAVATRLDQENALMRAKIADWVSDVRVDPVIRAQMRATLYQIDALDVPPADAQSAQATSGRPE